MMTHSLRFPLALLCLISVAAAGDNWTGFQNGGHISVESNGTLGELRWSRNLTGYGQSTPLVWGDTIYVTSVLGDQKEECLIAGLSLADGSEKWQHKLKNATPAANNTYVSRAAPTPVCDAAGLVAFFEGGNMVALGHDGSVRWQRDLVADYGDVAARHGLASSLEHAEGRVFVWVERSADPYVLCLDRKTGETLWKTAGVGATSWASPRLIDVEGGQHLVLSAIGSVVGLDPATGKRLWTLEGISGNSTPTPIPMGDGRFLLGATTGRGGSGARAAEFNGVVKVQPDGDAWSVDYVWRAKRATSSFGSPIVHGDLALFVNREGVLYGLDRATGEERFAKRLKGSVWATPYGQGNKVHFFQKDGRVETMTMAGDTQSTVVWDKLPAVETDSVEPAAAGGPGSFGGPVLYGVAFADDVVLLRRGDQLSAVSLAGSEN